MKLKDPLTLVLIGQLVVLMGAVGFFAGRAGSGGGHPPPAPAPAPHAAAEKKEEPEEEPPHEAPAKLSEADEGKDWNAWEKKKDAEAEPHAEAPSFESLVSEFVAGNARFVEGTSKQRDLVAQRKSVAGEERAGALVITCTDSRVVPELAFDQPVGTFWVLRTAGGQVDASSAREVDDAIKRLHPSVVLVLGHADCHHVKHALSSAGSKRLTKPTTLTAALSGLKGALEGEALDEGASINAVSFAAQELQKHSKALRASKDLALLRILYTPATGSVRWLDAEQPRAGR